MSRNSEMRAAWRTRRQEIDALTDPAEKVLSLKSLQDDLKQTIDRQPDVNGKIGLAAFGGGAAAFFIGLAASFCPIAVAGFVLFLSSPLLIPVENILPSTRRLKNAEREIGGQIDDILASESAENFASSPHLERAIRTFPVLHERFADAARARLYRQQMLPEKADRRDFCQGGRLSSRKNV